LHIDFRHTEDMHLLQWTVLTNVFLDFLHVELEDIHLLLYSHKQRLGV
jgi:hypothetical protein